MPPAKFFGPYRVVRLLGRGGMGEVYEVIHSYIERRAAVKVLRADLAADSKLSTRFLNEARAVNLIGHPSLVNIYDFGQEGEQPYIVMEYLDGVTLLRRLESLKPRGMDPQDGARILLQIASGLTAAHAKGIIHRDLKPTNLMLVPEQESPSPERVKILDFGIAKILVPEGTDTKLTNSDSILGTPTYMSPEQCHNASDVTDRSDVYSLGALAYEMLTGQQPFRGYSDIDTIIRHQTLTPPPPRQIVPKIPIELDELVMRMLRKKPLERPSAAEVKQILKQLAGSMPVSATSMPPLHQVEGNPPSGPSIDPDATVVDGARRSAPVQGVAVNESAERATMVQAALVVVLLLLAVASAVILWLR